MFRVKCGILLFALNIGIILGQTPKVKKTPFEVPKAVGHIEVDGKVTEDAWNHALKLELSYEVSPGENIPPPVKTELFITYDEEHLLVGFKSYDPEPSKVQARFSDRDTPWSDDLVGIVLDTFNDERRAYEFFANPLGVQIDAVNDDINGNYDISWNAIWESEGQITAEGYEVEMAIPFSQLRFNSASGPQIWGIDAVRNYPRNQRHHITLFPRERGNNSYLSQAEKIIGFDGITQGKNLEVVPTLTAIRTEGIPMQPPPGKASLEKLRSDEDLGISTRWGITPDVTLNATINPDFSQVEADSVQLDVNEQFTLRYPETRPFFKEGADYFQSSIDLVHTRVLVDPDAAIKLTGKKGRHTFGAFAAKDAVTPIIMPNPQFSDFATMDFESNATVGRYRYDFGRNSTVGAMLLNREGSGYYNRLISLDGIFRFSDSDALIFNGVRSETQYDNQEIAQRFRVDPEKKFKDDALNIEYQHKKRNWKFSAEYEDFGDEFRADLGFQPQVGFKTYEVTGEYIWHSDGNASFNKIRLGTELERSDDQAGSLLDETAEAYVIYEGPKEITAFLALREREQFFANLTFDQTLVDFSFEIRPAGSFIYYVQGTFGDAIDFSNARAADRHFLFSTIRYNLGAHLYFHLAYTFESLDIQGETLYNARVPEAQIYYHFNTKILFRAVLQHTDVDFNSALAASPYQVDESRLESQLLFSYQLNPQTVAFVGYTDRQDAFGENVSLEQTGRTFFIKFGYAWLK